MVTSTDAIKLYNGDGVTTRFPITLEHTSEDDIKVESINNDTGAYADITDWTYTVEGEAVYCDLAVALSSDYKLMLSLDIAGTQPVHLIDGAPYVPNVLEKLFDRLTLKDNQIISRLKGALAAPVEEGQEDMRLPPASARASKFMYFDSEGKPSVDPNVVAKPASDYMQGVLTQETSKAARSALETDKNNVNAVDAAYTVLDDDDYEVIEATGGVDGIPIILPTLADNAGRVLKILKVDADPGVITIDGEGAETINGEETQVLAAQYEAITVIAGTTEWKVLNAGKKSSLTVAAKSADYTITDTDNIDILEVITGATDKTMVLPTLADNQGRSITIKKADDGDGAVVIDGEGAETIQGTADFSMVTQFESITLYAGPTEWGVSSYDSKDGTGGEVGDVKWVLHDIEKNGWKNAKYQSKSQMTYAEFFGLVGHGYAKNAADAATAQALGEFRFPDGRFLFPRAGTQSWPLTPVAFDTATDQITITGHGLETDGSQNGRPMKLLRVPGQSPTMPTGTGYTEYDQNYVRVIDADTIELYDTEAHAIDTSVTDGRIDWTATGSGVFKLTTQGCYQASAVGPHYHVQAYGGDGGGARYDEEHDLPGIGQGYDWDTGGAGPVQTDAPKTSPPDNDEHRNEGRPSFVSMNMQIKVIGISVSTGEAYDQLHAESGWIANSDWTDVTLSFPIPTSLQNRPININVWVSPNNNGDDKYQIAGNDYGFVSARYGQSTHILNNEVLVSIGDGGIIFEDENNGQVILNTQAWYYNIEIIALDLYAPTKTSPLVTISESGQVPIETVEKTVVIPDSVTSSLYITLTAGAGINETNCIWIKNKSDEIQHVLYSTQAFWIEPGQKVKFYLDGTILVWASAGWELVYKDYDNTAVRDFVDINHGTATSLPAGNYKALASIGNPLISTNAYYFITSGYYPDFLGDGLGPTISSSTAKRLRFEPDTHRVYIEDSEDLRALWLWHDAA